MLDNKERLTFSISQEQMESETFTAKARKQRYKIELILKCKRFER